MHLTLVPPFVMSADIEEHTMLQMIDQEGRAMGPITIQPKGEIRPGAFILVPDEIKKFGPEDKPEAMIDAVTIADPAEKITQLHQNLLHAIGAIGCQFIHLNPDWSGENYSPHVTMKSGRTLDRPFIITTLSLARKDAEGKSVVGTVDMYNQRFS